MSQLIISSVTREFLRVKVRVMEDGEPVDISGFPTSWAFMLVTDTNSTPEPTEIDWFAGTITAELDYWYSSVLIGAGTAFDLVDGTYSVWVRIVSGSEAPARNVGRLIVT